MKFTKFQKIEKCDYLRLKFLISQYSIDKNIDPSLFYNLINEAYYKFSANEYSPNYEKILLNTYEKIFKQIPSYFDVIDIGAGTGASYRIINDINYKYNHYHFIEPSSYMVEKFNYNESQSNKLTISIGYLGNVNIPTDEQSPPRVFLLCASLRCMVDLRDFLTNLNLHMRSSDYLLLALEPNNLDTWVSKIQSALDYANLALSKINSLLKRYPKNHEIHLDHLDKSLAYLKQSNVVNNNFTKEILYYIIYYQNFHLAKKLCIPEEFSEGFYTFEDVEEMTNSKILIEIPQSFFTLWELWIFVEIYRTLTKGSGSVKSNVQNNFT